MNGGMSANYEAMDGYVSANAGLADSIASSANNHLGSACSIPADLFGQVGEESGVHAKLSTSVRGLHDYLQGAAQSVRGLGSKVEQSKNSYLNTDGENQVSFDDFKV